MSSHGEICRRLEKTTGTEDYFCGSYGFENKTTKQYQEFFNKVMSPQYSYPADVTAVYDGDTITCSIQLGFGVELKKQKIH